MSTVDGPRWKKQRNMVQACFNEHNNEIVWAESIYLAGDMLQYWSSKSTVKTTADDTRTLSLHVLSRAGFGQSFKFEGHDERREASPSANYKASLQTILENCVLIMAFGTTFLANPWLPRKLRRLHEACSSFQNYMTTLYEREKQALSQGESGDRNLMTSLVRASWNATKTEGALTEQEIYGNMFVFNFAGHDTTAHTFNFAIYFLVSNPEVQDWLCDEIRQVFGNRSPDSWRYDTDFPRLKRCLSIVYETVRLYTPVPVAKWTGGQSQILRVKGKSFVLPPRTMVIPSYSSVQTDPSYWGSDSLEWRPSRWVKTDKAGQETFLTPRRGTFIGWSEGARDCPGKKFSQVETVATLARLLRDYRVDPVVHRDENAAAARARILYQIETDSAPVPLLQMLHPERSPLVWSKR